MKESIKTEFINIVGKEYYSDNLIDLISYSKDASEAKHRPEAAIWASDKHQVAKILELANKESIPVTARGAGTGLVGLAVPEKGGIVLDMGRMNKILEINIEDRLVVVEPGVVYAELQEKLAPDGFFFPPDPASGKVCTLGGNVATNAGGIKGAKYGTTKDYVLALEVILPNGKILQTGSRCMKTSSGYDLTKLFVGSEGTLGVITEITLKISPKPPLTSTAMGTFDSVEDAGRAVTAIMRSGILPCVLEVMDKKALVVINSSTDLNLPEVEAVLVTETDGFTKNETEFQMEKIVEVMKKNNATTVTHAKSVEEAEAIWAGRRSIGGAMARVNNAYYAEDLAVPMSKVADTLKVISDLAKKYNLRITTCGHAGDGNLHPAISVDRTDADELRRMHEASAELFKKVVEFGGTLTGEHGIGTAKAPFMLWEHTGVAMEVMRGLKKLFDPNNILNPGKMALEG